MELTLSQLRQFLPKNKYVEHWHDALKQLLPDYDINTPQRIAAFLAQCAHESAGFTALKENLNYKPATLLKLFGKYFTPEMAAVYCAKPNKQEAIANRIYANRMGNGSEDSGDGYRYSGKGLIQLTGKSNYQAFADSLEITPTEAAEYMQTFEGACQSACWFWETNNLNRFADVGDFETMTKRINGGTIGLEDRKKHYAEALHILGA
jgi:putative chitinase